MQLKSQFPLLRRVVILVIVMLIVVPLLNITESDNTQILAVQLVQNMAVYSFNNSTLYQVRSPAVYFCPFYKPYKFDRSQSFTTHAGWITANIGQCRSEHSSPQYSNKWQLSLKLPKPNR